MSHEFNDSEMYYCDICGEYLPLETMYELPDGRIVCEDCLNELDAEWYKAVGETFPVGGGYCCVVASWVRSRQKANERVFSELHACHEDVSKNGILP